MRDVARLAGVSPMTVSRVINDPGRVQPETRERVLAAIATLRYVPPKARRAHAGGRPVIALILADLRNPFFTQIAHGAEEIARQQGYGVILHNTDEDLDREWDSLLTVRDAHVAGVIWTPYGDASNVSARLLLDAEVPTVLVDRLIPGAPSFDAVISDNRNAARRVVAELAGAGSRHVAVVLGKTMTSVVRDRLLGCQDAFAEVGMPWEADRVVTYCDPVDPQEGVWDEIVGRLPAVDAIFAWNQVAAAPLFRAARRAGRRIPETLRFGTFDDPDPYKITPGWFVVAEQDPFRMGVESARRLFNRLASPSDTVSTAILPVTVRIGRHALSGETGRSSEATVPVTTQER
jgi:LacI family transcriptional regulator